MQTQPAVKPAEPISGLWWLVPFFLAFIGGLIAYFVLKDRNQKTAEHMLIFGIVWTFVGGILVALVAFALFYVTSATIVVTVSTAATTISP